MAVDAHRRGYPKSVAVLALTLLLCGFECGEVKSIDQSGEMFLICFIPFSLVSLGGTVLSLC